MAAGAVDAGAMDAGAVDAGAVDAGAVDAGAVDAGAVDAGAVDAGAVDAGAVDAGAVDAGAVDAGAVDAGDAARPRAATEPGWSPFSVACSSGFPRRRNANPKISAATAAPTAIAAPVLNGAAAGFAASGTGNGADTADTPLAPASGCAVAPEATSAGAAGFTAGAAPRGAAAVASGAGLPIPCFCNSISTRFFSASNCCRLDGRACAASAPFRVAPPCAASGTGVATSARKPASLVATGAAWIEPAQTCGPLSAALAWAGAANGTDAPTACPDAMPTGVDTPDATAAEPGTLGVAKLGADAPPGVATNAGAIDAAALAADACAAPAAALALTAGAAPAAAAPDAPCATAAPVASSGGTVSVAPIRSRLGSCFMKACGFASNSARPVRANTPGSRDCVTAAAMSFSDCPGSR